MRKKDSKFTRTDLLIVLLCLAGALLSAAAFWREYNTTLQRLNDEPVGTITFQRRVAQRRFVDRHVWDRLKLATPVFNGDTIRTIEKSEAVIVFDDEVTRLSLNENTMIQIFFDNIAGTQIDLFGGNLEVESAAEQMTITTENSTMQVHGQARIQKNEEGIVVYVTEGRVYFEEAEVEIEAGEILKVNPYGEITEAPVISVTSLGASTSLFTFAHGRINVPFSWNEFSFAPDTYVVIEIASDRRFNRIVERKTIAASQYERTASIYIPLYCGSYWWRVFPAHYENLSPLNQFFPSGSLQILSAVLPFARQFPVILFAANSSGWYALDEETGGTNYRTLSEIAEFLSVNSTYRLLIEGHANHTTNPGFNYLHQREHIQQLLPLSQARALGVFDRLVELGADPQRLNKRAAGGERPIVPWGDSANWQKNRRAEFVVYNTY